MIGGPREIVLNDAPRPAPAVVKVAAADAAKQRATAGASRTAPIETASTALAGSAAQPRSQPVALASRAGGGMAGMWGASTQNVKNWLHLGGQDQPAQPEVAAYIPDQPIPTDVPLPPRRDVSVAQAEKPHVAQKVPLPPSKPGETSPPPPPANAGAAATTE